MRSARIRNTIAAPIAIIGVVAALAGCSSTGSSAYNPGAQASLPPVATAQQTVKFPEGAPDGVSVVIGRDDDFISSWSKSNGYHGVVLALKNTSDKPIVLRNRIGFGPETVWGFGGGSALKSRLDQSKMPAGCRSSDFADNSVTFLNKDSESITVKPGKTLCATARIGQYGWNGDMRLAKVYSASTMKVTTYIKGGKKMKAYIGSVPTADLFG